MYQLILIIHVLTAACLIILVLVQQGRGATMGAAFGSGASQTVFGSRGSGSFLLKVTIGFVIVFFSTSIVLNRMATMAVHHSTQLNLPVHLSVPAKTSGMTPNDVPTLPSQTEEKPKPTI